MNFLAHAYLSFGDPDTLAGNMISDFVKGAAQFSFPPAIRKGIILHRFIDSETDAHEATQKAKSVFRKDYRLYSAPITDIIFDHFLATDKGIFTEASLFEFSQSVYQMLEKNTA